MRGATVVTNLDALGKVIGAVNGLEGLNEDLYMNSIIKIAHKKAANAFDIAAAATAAAQGNMSHMYEYGVPGITRGPARFTSGSQKAAHLYVHTLDQRHEGSTINYVFRPAEIPNPRWTTKDTGVPSRFLKKLSNKKYLFKNRAFVTETGRSVNIAPKDGGKYLFIPFGPGVAPKNPDSPTAKYGFTYYNYETKGPLKVKPGRTNVGAFSKFWTAWWSTEGQYKLTESMQADVLEDFDKALGAAAASAVSGKLSSVLSGKAGLDKNIAWGRSNTLRILNQRARSGL